MIHDIVSIQINEQLQSKPLPPSAEGKIKNATWHAWYVYKPSTANEGMPRLLLISCEIIYQQIIKFCSGWMQHNDCVIMQIIACPLVPGQKGWHLFKDKWEHLRLRTDMFGDEFITVWKDVMSKHHQHSDKEAVLQQLLYGKKHSSFSWPGPEAVRSVPDEIWRWCTSVTLHSRLHNSLSGEVHGKLIELGPRDNRGIPLSVSIKWLEEPSGVEGWCVGGGWGGHCLVAGQMLPTGEWGDR